MNKCIKTLAISLLLIITLPMAKLSAQVSIWDGYWEPWTQGAGTEINPFLIENARQLAYLALRVNNGTDAGGGHVSNHNLHYKLMIDVDLNGGENLKWTPIGYWESDTDYQCFGGHFDGNGHRVLGLYVSHPIEHGLKVGLFGYTDGASIESLGVESYITAACDAASLIGLAKGTTSITNCYASGILRVACLDGRCGGIVGGVDNGNLTITNCYNTGSVTASNSYLNHYCGGIVGYINSGSLTITNCYNTGEIETINSAGYDYYQCCGGIVGCVNSASLTITNCYNTGNLSCTHEISCGGIVGEIISNECNYNITNCYYRTDCGGTNQNGGLPMSEEAMKSEGFVNTLNNGSETWIRDTYNVNQEYPILSNILYVSVTTTDVTNITETQATLNGTIYTSGVIMSCGFEYKKASDTEYQTIPTNDYGVISSDLSGLEPNTEYLYRAFCALNNGRTYYGKEKTFEFSWLNFDTICIHNADMLRWVSEQCNSGTTFEGYCIRLMNDITLPLNVPNNMTSIGSYPNHPFKGTFDGNGKLITNLYIDQPNTPYQGFFGYTLNASLYNVGLVNITASGRNYTGGMVAYAKNTYMRDCYVNGGTLFALSYCGGLVGYQEQGTNSIISGCYNTCEVTGNNYVGGLIGFSNYSTVRNSYVAGRVSAQGEPVGAIIGGANEVLMYYCYFSTELTGQTNAIGWNNIGKDGGEGLTNAQMRDPQFVNTLNQNLATPVWMADYTNHINNGFPIIKWQRPGTSVEENVTTKNYISLYPNPAKGFVTIQSDEPIVSLKHVEVYDVMGRKVMSEALDGQSQMLNIAKLLSGVYHVRVQTDNGRNTNIKMVVQ